MKGFPFLKGGTATGWGNLRRTTPTAWTAETRSGSTLPNAPGGAAFAGTWPCAPRWRKGWSAR